MAIEINGTTGISGVDGSATTPALQGQDTNTGISFGTDEVNVVTGGTTRTTVDSSGRLLVGTTTTIGAPRVDVVGNSDSATNEGVLQIRRGSSATSVDTILGVLNFGDTTSGAFKRAQVLGVADGASGSGDLPARLVFTTTPDGSTVPTERLRITSNGTLQLRNSPGIDFSQIQTNLAGMESETLDSYEEGTWTPTWQATTSSGTWAATGRYVKIGRQVTVEVKQTSGIVAWNAQNYIIGGLPFAPSTGTTGAAGVLINNSPNIHTGVLAWSSARIYAIAGFSSQNGIIVNITYQTDS